MKTDPRQMLVETASQLVRKRAPKLYYWVREREIADRQRNRDTPSFIEKSAQRRLMRRLCDANGTALDIGANRGDYAIEMARASRRVVLFEPMPRLHEKLRDLALGAPCEMTLEPVALSDKAGTAVLRIPVGKLGSSTLEQNNVHVNSLASQLEVEEVTVQLKRLDDYRFDEIAVIKIDVEGHQLPLFAGATETLARCKPHLLVEIDETHVAGSLDAVDARLRGLDYEGFYLLSTCLFPMRTFDRAVYHSTENRRTGKLRINDFFYFHRDRIAQLAQQCPEYIVQR